jgi:hypothetical protein
MIHTCVVTPLIVASILALMAGVLLTTWVVPVAVLAFWIVWWLVVRLTGRLQSPARSGYLYDDE